MNNAVFDNKNYTVTIGESLYETQKFQCYQIINKETNVVEAETTVLPRAIGIANEYSEAVDELLQVKTERPIFAH